jgi:hypothetical protein
MTALRTEGPRLLRELCAVSVRGLPAMADRRTGLFPHKVVLTTDGRVEPRGENALYSAISIIGLLSVGRDDPWTGPVSLGRALDAVAVAVAGPGSSDAALAGTVLWALALAGDARVPTVVDRVERLDADALTTMEVALVIAGAVAAMERVPEVRDRAARIARDGVRALLERWSSSAALFAGPRGRRPATLAARNVTSFANQVYPLHAIARYAQATSERVPDAAVRTAERLVAHQGPLGQWWWQYSARDGGLVEGYPVYSVHQDGMAFLGLAALQAAGGGRYADALWRGLLWVDGANELGRSLVRRDHDLVLRCIQRAGSDPDGPSGLARRNLVAVQLASWGIGRRPAARAHPSRLEVLAECRPYHLGWVLYAGSLAGALME